MPYDEILAQRIRSQLEPGIVEKKMFGGIGFLVNGNMACGVNRDRLIVRLDPDEYEAALQKPGARVFDLTGRPMRGWVSVAPEGLQTDADLQAWIDQGLAFARSLPPK